MKKKFNFLRLGLICLFVFVTELSVNAQIFTSPGGYRSVKSESAGDIVVETPTAKFGNVFVKNAPVLNGNVGAENNRYKSAGIPSTIVDNARFLGNGVFAKEIADMWAVKQTGIKLNARPATAPNVAGAIVINSAAKLNMNRSLIQDNVARTIIFQGNINVGYPILVGSNKTIWVDGKLNYVGVQVVAEGGANFTPRPLFNDGLFSVRTAGAFKETYPVYKVTNPENLPLVRIGTPAQVQTQINNRSSNDALIKKIKDPKTNVENVTFKGTKRGLIKIGLGTTYRDDSQVLPLASGIVTIGVNNLTIDGLRIESALNALYITGGFNVNVKNCFIDKTIYRAIHLHGATSNSSSRTTPGTGWGNVTNNLLTNSLFDGIDLDSNSGGFLVSENVIIGARDRFLIWSEIGAFQNVIDNNVGILLPGRAAGKLLGGYQENGTELNSSNQPTKDNTWSNNHSFYGNKTGDGFVMRAIRKILFATIKFNNNYVWTTSATMGKHNPKRGNNNDVFFLERTSGGGATPFSDGGGITSVTGLSGTYFIQNNTNASQKLTLEANNNAKMAASTGANARWKFVYNPGDKTYTVQSELNNRYLEVPWGACRARTAPFSPGPANNTNYNVGSWTSATAKNQKWFILKEGADYVFIPSHCTDNAMDRDGGGLNANVHLFLNSGNFKGGTNQKWSLVRPSGSAVESPVAPAIGNIPATGIPFDKTVGISILSGNGNFLQINNSATEKPLSSSGGASAPTQVWQTWERFVFRRFPNGNVGFYSVVTGKYLQVNGSNKTGRIKINNSLGKATVLQNWMTWEQFKWNSLGGDLFSLQSAFFNDANSWVKCDGNNMPVFTNGTASANASKFKYVVVSETAGKQLNGVESLGIEIYPNPVNGGHINIDSKLPKAGAVNVTIHSLNGAVVYENNAENVEVGATLTVNTNAFTPGVYIVKVVSNGIVETQKLVVK